MKKICLHCNAVLEDSAKFCPNCGTDAFQTVTEQTADSSQENTPLTDEQTSEIIAPSHEDSPAAVHTAESQPADGDQTTPKGQDTTEKTADDTNSPFRKVSFEKAKPKSTKKLVKILAFTLIPLALVIAILLNMNAIIGLAIKTFGSDAGYYQYVEKNAVSSFADSFSAIYDSAILEALEDDQSFTSKISVNISDDASALLKSFISPNDDFSWLNDVSLTVSANTKGDKLSASIGCFVSDRQVLLLNSITDLKNEMTYFAFDGLSDEILGIDLSDVRNGSGLGALADVELKAVIPAIRNVLPDENQVEKLIDRYFKIILKHIDDVERYRDTLNVGDLSREYTVLEVSIDEETFIDMALDVLNEAKDDKDIAGIIKQIASSAGDLGLSGSVSDMTHSDFVDWLDEGIEVLEDKKDDSADDRLLVIRNYVDGSHEIVGRTVLFDEQELLSYATVEDGSDYTFRLVVNANTAISVTGNGTQKGNEITGTYEVRYGDRDICTLKLADFNTKDAKKGELNGKVTIIPDASLFSDLNMAYTAVIAMIDPSLSFTFETSGNKKICNVNLLKSGEPFIGLTIDTKVSGAQIIDDVSSANVVDFEGMGSLREFIVDLDIDKLLADLKQTSIPSDYIDQLESLWDSVRVG